MGLAETFALLREHSTLADVLRTLEATGMEATPRLPPNVVVLSQERAKRRQRDREPGARL